MEKKNPIGMRIGESTFCAGYLIFALVAGLVFLGGTGKFDKLCAIMILLLGGGDAFHLIPRILVNIRGEAEKDTFWLGLGNLVSSVTMTIFYGILIYVIQELKGQGAVPKWVETAVWILVFVRILLCLLPQNRWFSSDKDPNWGLIRNVPFLVIGLLTVGYLFACGETLMAVLVIVSFACYMGVVLCVAKKPMMGMLMIPKTICYIWIVCLLLGRR
ncbi:MAG: hypothetical protein IJ091_09815 [Oscillospiraceae bacterium]|nr:hypothetical protein [Oscillospiraceae bacterium]